jgi:ATP-dependent DNA ligase
VPQGQLSASSTGGRLKRGAHQRGNHSLPTFIPPQLSLLVKAPPTGENWAHELKYDGFRFHARIDRGKVKLLARTGLDWTDKYASTAGAIGKPPPRSTRFGSPLVLSRVKWVKPKLVAQVRFLTWTADGLLRQVSYQGLREDKHAKDVRRPQAM